MQGDDRTRFCKLCQKNVYNLSGMNRDEAEQLIEENNGELCVRFFRRRDGTLLTVDCPVGLREVRARMVRGALGIAATILALVGSLLWGKISSASSGGRGTGIQEIDYGPLSRFSDWVNPPQVMGSMCPPVLSAPPPPASNGTGSAPESAY